MTRKIKALGLAFVAIAAMSMAASGGAQAAELHATQGVTAAIFGQQLTQHLFTIDAGIVKCNQATFEGLATGGGQTQTTAQELQVTGTYAQCNISGLAATVDMNGCKYTITGAGQAANTVQVDITGCTAGKVITVTSATCTVTVPEQHSLTGHIVFTNIPEPTAVPHDVQANITISGITYQTHGTCPNTVSDHTATTTTGTYSGQATFQAREHKGSQGVTLHGHEFNKLNQTGALKGLIAT
jgi:hypothetical protein